MFVDRSDSLMQHGLDSTQLQSRIGRLLGDAVSAADITGVHSAGGGLRTLASASNNQFTLLGADLLIDVTGKIWLIEVNAVPDLMFDGPEHLRNLLHAMLTSMLDEILVRRPYPESLLFQGQAKPQNGWVKCTRTQEAAQAPMCANANRACSHTTSDPEYDMMFAQARARFTSG
eukprot:gnl/TRDRNA2_/TRDRNA2_87493_c0_seq1.p1 gnl/TRDRNA2_/TRDRNA2_87493_c0~~gnl/TRDRNA2_/TRDRNA2_87493_c0_seq1.p1  ORF type:complete len:174 (+),score=13.38 gnl/TRDRNA2_/TRDRNA2_87493_c0_seq1:274-795(+)